ncbi:pyridoxal phosphate-dependent aminotransferase [Streptomyces sp. NBC_01224]|uniref:pyridoxal phosphate-dependent aminotransferase n=1 Tax=Streptomyces sp. NBC_01224 TaxID=2903783 RepID=UPI002E0D9715|nr:pyridoxal phosphate-dependent aminotransferase [Streptomyces sp. NBC_01224]
MSRPSHASLLDGLSEAPSVRFNNRIYEMKDTGADVITMSLGEAFFDISMPSFDGMPSADIHHYSHSRGVPLLRQKLAKHASVDSGLPVDPDSEILVTAGSKLAIYMALTAVLEQGDEVIIPEPAWVSYPDQVRMCRGVPVMVPWHEGYEAPASYITPRTRAIVVNNPHNPTGRRLGTVELQSLHDLAVKHSLFIIADEAYSEFLPKGERFISADQFDPERDHAIVCKSMSKNYGISGWRIGYLIANRFMIEQINKLQQHIITCAPTILSCYLAENYDMLRETTRPQISRVVDVRNRMAEELAARDIRCLPGDSTFYLFASLGESRLNSEDFATELLSRHKVAVVPGIGYGGTCDRFIRIAVGAEPEERLLRGIDAIASMIAATR